MRKKQIALLLGTILSGIAFNSAYAQTTDEQDKSQHPNPYAEQFGYPKTRTMAEDPNIPASQRLDLSEIHLRGTGSRTYRSPYIYINSRGRKVMSRNRILRAENGASDLKPQEEIKRDDGVDIYYNKVIVDKYRWLEEVDEIDREYSMETDADRKRDYTGTIFELNDFNADVGGQNFRVSNLKRDIEKSSKVKPEPVSEVTQWVDAQNAVTKKYLHEAPIYEQVKELTNHLYKFEYDTNPIKMENGEFIYSRNPDTGFYTMYRIEKDGTRTPILEQSKLSQDGTTRILSYSFNPSGDRLAYFTRDESADADEATLHVIDTNTKKEIMRPITYIPHDYTSMIWENNDALYYIKSQNGWWNVLRHRFDKNHLTDEMVFRASDYDYNVAQSVWFENDSLIVSTYRGGLYMKELKPFGRTRRLHSDKVVQWVSRNGDDFYNFQAAKAVSIEKEHSYIISEDNDRNGQLLKIETLHPERREIIVPGTYGQIQEAVKHGDYFFVIVNKDTRDYLFKFDAKGNLVKDLTPGLGEITNLYSYAGSGVAEQAVKGNDQESKGDEAYVSYTFQSPTLPSATYKTNPDTGKVFEVNSKQYTNYNSDNFETKQVFYTSFDGTQIPMTISHKKGLKMDGKNPTILYGYGGFNTNAYPNAFSLTKAVWTQLGGVFATAGIRGGNEYGDAWHYAGWRMNKMNVFKDFKAAADYLIKEGYTSHDYLALKGGSNGGLLVGATMTLYPDLARVALPGVGVLDMLRHDKQKTGNWRSEYGTTGDSKEMFEYLLSYSPYHNVRSGVCYPSTLVTTSKRDDRVMPSHSYKFTAALQEHQSCARPVMLYAAEQHGHGAFTAQETKDDLINEVVFTLNEMGFRSIPH